MSKKRSIMEEVATDAVQRAGLHSLSFRTLADEVGVKSSSVHYYFPEKSSLARVLIENYTEAFSEKLADIDRRKLMPRKKLEAFVKLFEEMIKEEKFCLCGMMAAEVATLNEDNRKLLSEYFRNVEDWLCATFEENAAEVKSEIKPRLLARIVMSGLEGAILIDRVDRSHSRLLAQRQLISSLVV